MDAMKKQLRFVLFGLLCLLPVFTLSAQEPLPPEPQPLPRALWDDQTIDDFNAIAETQTGFTPENEPFFFSHDVIPPTIKVGITGYLHCRDWLNAGQPVQRIEEMPFSDYVKNVLPNEWVNTWPIESLRAGAVAVKMFAWWRINLGGVRPGGAHVVDNTCDQVYVGGSARATTNAAVDDTWNDIMRANGRVVEIHYLNTDENCALYFPNVRCMGQWGSKARADEGMTWQDILHYYYDPVEITKGSSGLPDAPANTNLIRNGDFSAGFNEWVVFGDASRAIYDGVLAFQRRANEGSSGGVLQSLPYAFTAGTTAEITLVLGNSSPVTKTPRVFLRNAFSDNDYIVCQFTIPPETPLQPYVMRGAVGSWLNPRFEVWPDPADSQPDVLMDNVTLHLRPSLSTTATGCYGPEATTQWNFAAGPLGWQAVSGLANPRLESGGTAYDVSGTPLLESPLLLNVAADEVNTLVLNMASEVDDCGAVSFLRDDQTTFSTAQRVTFSFPPDGEPHTTYIDLGDHPNWTGQITRLRFEPACTGEGVVRLISLALVDASNAPLLISPAGIISDSSPDYVWQHVAGATDYQLYVANGRASFLLYERFPAAAHCTGDTCTVDPTRLDDDYRLTSDSYSAYVRAWDGDQPGSWFGPFTFRLQAAPPALVSLMGTTNTQSSRPVFNWRLEEDSATHFRLYVAPQNDLADTRLDQWVARADVCSGLTCAYPSPVDMVNGRYSLYIQSWGPGGLSEGRNGGFAGPGDFQISAPPPAAPANITMTPTPFTIQWQGDAYASWAQLYIGSTEGETVHFEWHRLTDCGGGTCTLQPDVVLPNGDYVVYLRVWGAGGINAGGVEGWVSGGAFTLNQPAPTIVTSGYLTATHTGRPVFNWSPLENASWYHLIVRDTDTVYHDAWVPGITCEAVCSVHPALDLPNGGYTWSLQAWGAGGLSTQTFMQAFTVNAVFPQAPELLAPEPLIYTLTPEFQWQPAPDAAWYQIEVRNAADDTVYLDWHQVGTLGCGDGICGLVLPERLSPQSYRWRVMTYTPAGVGEWSRWRTFTIS
ncbi:MAG: hypothetical protein OHK0046_44920 [Anaerolineae bacterium]